jgi:ribulose-phosphate 3-epimerase
MQITPVILETDPNELKRKIALVESAVDLVQIDVGDGTFIPTVTVLPRALGEFRPLTSFEVHLMVQRPDHFVNDWVELGAKRVIFHVEAEGDLERFIVQCRELDCDIGITLNPETSVDKIEPYLNLVDEVMFMAIQPGAQGNPFIPKIIDAIAEFHMAFPSMPLAVDGGVNEDNITKLAAVGVQRVCVGSTLWKSDDPVAMISRLATKK